MREALCLLYCSALLLYCFTAALLLLCCFHTHRYVREALVCSEEKMRLQVPTNQPSLNFYPERLANPRGLVSRQLQSHLNLYTEGLANPL